MAISWGAWKHCGSGCVGMRVGIDVSRTSVSHGSGSVKFTFKFYTQNEYKTTGDQQWLQLSGSVGGDRINFNNTSGTGAVLRATRTYTYNYGSSSYGTSPGKVTASATLGGHYAGITPSRSVSSTIPARPYARPAAPSGVSLSNTSDSAVTIRWTRHATAGEPYNSQTVQTNTYSGSSWGGYDGGYSVSGGATSFRRTGLSSNHAYRFRVRANNSVGSSGYAYSGYYYTTPAAPSGVKSKVNSSGTQITTTWNNEAYTNSSVKHQIQRSDDGGAWHNVKTGISQGTTSWTDTSPGGGDNRYRVRTVRGSLTSGYTTGNTVTTVVPPLMVTNMQPDGVTLDLDRQVVFTWQHNPGADGADQTMFQIVFSDNGGSTYTAWRSPEIASADSVFELPAGTLENGTTYLYLVRTKGTEAGGWGPWNYPNASTIQGSSTPEVNISDTADVRTNLVEHPSAERGVDGWEIVNGTAVSTDQLAAVGEHSLQLSSGGSNAYVRQTVPGLIIGQEYTASVYRYAPSSKPEAVLFTNGSSNPMLNLPAPGEQTAEWSAGVTVITPTEDNPTGSMVSLDNPTITVAGVTDGTPVTVWDDGGTAYTGVFAGGSATMEIPADTTLVNVMVGDSDVYFDGDTESTYDVYYRWTGDAGASPSEEVQRQRSGPPNLVFKLTGGKSGDPTYVVSTAKDQWVRQSFTFTATDTTQRFSFSGDDGAGNSFTSGDMFVDGFVVEHGDTLGDYFDGDTEDPTGALNYIWVGDPSNSQSRALPTDSVESLPLTVTWNYTQDEGISQSAWEAKLFDGNGDVELESQSGTGSGTSVTFDRRLLNGETYVVAIRARSAAGLWSDWDFISLNVELPPPAAASITPEYDDCAGTMILHITVDDPAEGELPVTRVIVERRIPGVDDNWVVLADDLEPPSDLLDPLPRTRGMNEYRVTSVSDAPSYRVSEPFEAPGLDEGLWGFLSYGPAWSTTLRIQGDLATSDTASRVRSTQAFLGRRLPVLMVGYNRGSEVSVSGSIRLLPVDCVPEQLDPCDYDNQTQDWRNASDEATVVCWRDYTGRRLFAMLGDVEIADEEWAVRATVSFGLTRVGYTETYDATVEDVDVPDEGSSGDDGVTE